MRFAPATRLSAPNCVSPKHYGKCLVEQGRTVEAVAHFEHALALRQARGDAGLIASTRAALAAVSGQWECRDAH